MNNYNFDYYRLYRKEETLEKNLLLVINPVSGDGVARNWIFDMIDILSKRYEDITVYLSKCAGDIERYVSQNAAGRDAVVCCGGDGTLHEVLGGIRKSGVDVPIGYIPTGTTNDFATSHGIPKNIKSAINFLVDAEPRAYDVGMIGDMPFTYVAAFGNLIDVCYKTPQASKASFGWAAYIVEGMKRLSAMKPYHLRLEADGKIIMGDFVLGMATNTLSVGGMGFIIHGDSKELLSDGLLEVMLVEYPDNAAKFGQIIKELTIPGTPQKLVTRFTAKQLRFTFDGERPEWTVDGEFGGQYDSVDVSIIPSGMRILESKTEKTESGENKK